MALLNPVAFYSFTEALAEKKFDLGSDDLKVALSNTLPDVSAHAVFADITEIASGSGYTAGGESITVASSSQTLGAYSLVASGSITWVSSGTIGPFRYLVFYDNTATNKDLISYFDIGTIVTLGSGSQYVFAVGTTLVTIPYPS